MNKKVGIDQGFIHHPNEAKGQGAVT